MSQTANSIPPKGGLWKLQASDWVKGLWLTIGGGVLALLKFLVTAHHLPTMNELWPYIDTISGMFILYIGKNWATNNVGQLGKADQPVMLVDKDHLKNLEDKAAQVDAIPTLQK
jgi:hypothetical protein